MRHAFKKRFTHICAINREVAKENRKQTLEGIAAKVDYHRDEWQTVICK